MNDIFPNVPPVSVPKISGNAYTYSGPKTVLAPPGPVVPTPTPADQAKDKGEPLKSCSNCVHFLSGSDNNEQVSLMGGTISADTCQKFRRVISNRSEKFTKEYQENKAAECKDYERAAASKNFKKPKSILIGMPSFSPEKSDDADEVNSCNLCSYSEIILNNHEDNLTGVDTTLAVCMAKGETISIGKSTEMASGCAFATLKNADVPSLTPLDDLEITEKLVEYTITPYIDPLDYPTDKEVTDQEKNEGVKAWRAINHEDSGITIMMPIFNPEFFTEVERSKIPRPGDQEMPELYQDHFNLLYQFIATWQMGDTPATTGIAGVGKSEAARHAAYMMQLPFERITITNSTLVDDLAGRTKFSKEVGTYFQYGRIPKAWGKPCVILIDEPNVGPDEVWQFIRPMTDNSKQLVLDMNDGERVEKHKHCYMTMAMNPSWDVRNVGTHDIGDADGRRLMHIFVPTPSESVERQIIFDRCAADGYSLDERLYSSIQRIGNDIRKLCDEDAIPIQWGVSQQIKVARASRYFPLKKCYQLATDYLDPDTTRLILNTVNNHVKQRPKKEQQ